MSIKSFLTVALLTLSFGAVTVPAFAQLTALKSHVKAMKVALEAQETADWINGPGKSQLSKLSGKDLSRLMTMLTWKRAGTQNGFSATWTGQIRPQQSGSYTFSVSPVDISTNVNKIVIGQWMTVSVDGQEVVNASLDNWEYEGKALQLSADVSVPIKITYRYESSNPAEADAKPPCAVLNWEGPGISKSVVPTKVLRTPDGSVKGLLAEYRSPEADGGRVLATVVEPRLEHVWMSAEYFISPHPHALQQVVAVYWEKMTDPALYAKKETPKPRLIGHPELASFFLTGEQRREFLEILINRPEILEKLSLEDACRFFSHFRYGTGELGIQILGTRMQSHFNLTPQLTCTYDEMNRRISRAFPVHYLWGLGKRGMELLQDKYLELDDGTCCLPVAYTLSYGHFAEGQLTDWIALLDAKLAEDDLTGELRINWLLARAHAEETRHRKVLAGREWMDEARSVAESEENQLRLLIEQLAHSMRFKEFKLVKQQLADAEGQLDQETFLELKMQVDNTLSSIKKQDEKKKASLATSVSIKTKTSPKSGL